MSSADIKDDEQHAKLQEISTSRKECTSCEQNNVDDITEGITSLAVLDDVTACASCGKEGKDSDMNTCNKCKMVKYCNAACKKKHRSRHKKACQKRVAELHEEALFKEHPPLDDCPICFIPMLPCRTDPVSQFQPCCGKIVCIGCNFGIKSGEGKDLCAFCRLPPPKDRDEELKKIKNLMDKGNGEAFNMLGGFYDNGSCGLRRDWKKAAELYLKGGELGCYSAYKNLAGCYHNGEGVELDKKKAKYYWELAAISGCVEARYELGSVEGKAGNNHRGLKHMEIAARAGYKPALDTVERGFKCGLVSKKAYEHALRGYHEQRSLMKSDARNKAAAAYKDGRMRTLIDNGLKLPASY